MANKKSSTTAVHPQTPSRKSVQINLTLPLLHDLINAGDGIVEYLEPERDELDEALLTVTIPEHLASNLVWRLGIIIGTLTDEENAETAVSLATAAKVLLKLASAGMTNYDALMRAMAPEVVPMPKARA